MADRIEDWMMRRRATMWGGAAAIVVALVAGGALPGGVVALGAIAAFVFVHYGLLEAWAPDEDAPTVESTPPLRAAALERAALNGAPAAAAASAPAAPPLQTAAPVATTEPVEAPAAIEAAPARPALHAAPPARAADDLKRIKGVGPKLEAILHALGVYHFDQIASWTAAETAWVDAHLEGFKGRVTRDGWVAQAQILAAGGATEFSDQVDAGAAPSSQG